MPMKFKKEIVTLLLASTLLTASLTGCNTAQNGGDDIDNATTEITTIETTPDTNPSDTAKPNEVIRDVPKLGKLKLVPYSDLKNTSIWRDENGEFFLYINEWDAYRQLSGLSSYRNWFYFTDNCIVIDDKTTTISLVDQVGKHDEPTIITYHFNKDNSLVELHAVSLNIIASSEYDTFFVNMHTADHGYYFLTPAIDGSQDWRMDGALGWPLFMFETTDGGKSWHQISTNTFDFCTSDHINIIKFVSPNVGIISFRYVNLEDLCERTYLTLDGGLTWNQISQLPYSSDEQWGYSEVVDMALIDDRYYLTVKISNNDLKQLQFWSKDLKKWTFEKSFDVSLSELEEKLGCYVSQEYGNNLEVAMRNDDAPFPIRFEYEEYKSTEFKMITQQGDDEFSITLPLKKTCRVLEWYSSFQDDLNGYAFCF